VSTVNQAPHEDQVGIRIANVELIISELASKAAEDIWFQLADVFAQVYQMRRPDADQPLEDSTAQQCPTVPDIFELLAISSVSDIRNTLEETIHVGAAQ